MQKPFPNFYYENNLWSKDYTVIGVDEVGRGALAGLGAVGLVCWKPNLIGDELKQLLALGINDSKKVTPLQRGKLSKIIKEKCLAYDTVFVDVSTINRVGIVSALNIAIRKGVKKIQSKLTSSSVFCLFDAFPVKNIAGVGLKNQLAIIKGDQLSMSIAAASIIAKVERDQYMSQLALEYPNYGWEENKGYGTQEHRESILKYGITKHHRTLFVRKILTLSQQYA